MAARVELTTHLPVSSDEVWEQLQTSALLEYIAAPLVKFVPISGRFPERWPEGEHRAGMLALGFLPIGEQTIGIEFPPAQANQKIVRDNGHGTLIKRWDHWIFIEPEGQGTRYTDRVDIEAGLLTPFIALFARVFYSHRQKRWRVLAETGFAALKG